MQKMKHSWMGWKCNFYCRTMLILLWILLPTCWGQQCTIKDGRFISCTKIGHHELYNQLFKYEDQLTSDFSLEVLDSNYTTIDYFARPNMKITFLQLKISRCSVTNIDELAFKDIAPYMNTLDLSQNNIEDVSFAAVFQNQGYGSFRLDLTGNKIKTIDLSILRVTDLILSSNLISTISRSHKYNNIVYNFLDLSYNKLEKYHEKDLNFYSTILDLRYNSLNDIQLYSSSTIVKLSGNNLTAKSIKNGNLNCQEIYLTSMPTNAISATKFVMSNSSIPTLNKTFVDLSKVSSKNIDFSNSSIMDIDSNFFRNVRWLNTLRLDGNKIQNIKSNLFVSTQINLLNVSHSTVEHIEKGAFEGLTSCQRLDLSHNFLRTTENICGPREIDVSFNNFSDVDLNNFIKCSNLMYLNMSHSHIQSIKPGSISIMKQLSTLDMSSNEMKKIPAGVFNFSNLLNLYLQDNKIEFIQPKAFNNMYKIILINLANNNIQSIEEETFSFLPVIREIDLSNNKVTILSSNAFLNLGVQKLNLNDNNIKYIKSKAFSGLNKIASLNFSSMGITYLEPQCFYNFSILTIIDLSNNKLSSLENHTFYNLPLNTILLSRNQIEVIEPYAFENLASLNEIDLSSNNIERIYENSFHFVRSNRIDLENNNISTPFHISLNNQIVELTVTYSGTVSKHFINNFYLKKLIFRNSTIKSLPKNFLKGLYKLEELHFKDSNVYRIEEGCLSTLYNLKYLDAQNLFKYTDEISKNLFHDLKNLKELNFSGVGIKSIEIGSFLGLKTLNSLIMSKNNLTALVAGMFSGLETSLESLDLSFNKIRFIENSTFDLLVNLESLYLNQNSLDVIPVLDLPKLNNLYLNDNNIYKIFLNSLNLPVLITLHLQNNKINPIPNNVFNSSTKLKELRLDNNELNSLSFGVFRGLENLERLNVSQNRNLFINNRESDYAIRVLSNLRYLNLADTFWITDDKSSIVTFLPRLATLKIDRNNFNCKNLLVLLKFFDGKNINYIPDYPDYDSPNVAGISCRPN